MFALLMRNRTVAASCAAISLLLGLAACSGADTQNPSSPAASNSAGTALSRPLEHIHGAGIDPSDGAILAGTHSGVWRISGTGEVTPTGESQDDFMGFTVAAAKNWLASGHPGLGSDAANPLGLIRSTDAGAAWTAVSLSGQVDFHTIAASGSTVVGFDPADGLMISSDDGSTWKQGTHIRPTSLAFAGTKLLAATEQGLLASTDSGFSFAPVADAPAALLLSSASSAVWCVDTGGVAWKSADSGVVWTKAGQVGEVSAIAAVDANNAFALTPQTVIKLT